MDRRSFLTAASAATATVLIARPGRADIIEVDKIARGGMQHLFTAPWGSGKGQLGHSPARESVPLAPASFFVNPDGDVTVLDTVNDRLVFFGPKGAAFGSHALPVKPGEAREFIDVASLEKRNHVVLERVKGNLLHLNDAGTLLGTTSFASSPSLKSTDLVTALLVDNASRHWIESQGKHHRVEPAQDANDVTLLGGTPSHSTKHVLSARLDRPRNVKINRVGATETPFADLHFGRDVGHIQSIDVTELGGAFIVVETHEERKVAPFDILKSELTGLELAPTGAVVRRFKVPASTDDGEVRRPSRAGRNSRYYAMVRTKKGVSFYVV